MSSKKVSAVIVLVVILGGVAGYFVWSKKTTPVYLNETTNTKTYVSDLGYSVDYPADWIVMNDGIKPAQPEILVGVPAQYFEVRLELENSSLETIRQNNNRNIGGQNLVESEITFGGEKAFAYIEKYSDEFYEVLVEHNANVYIIWTQKYTLDEVKKIFSSFKFTKSKENINLTNWKTYTNTKYGFEVKYPDNYFLTEKENRVSVKSSKDCVASEGEWPKDCFGYDLLIQANKISVSGTGISKTETKVAGYSAEKIQDLGMGDGSDFVQTIVQFNKSNNWYINIVSSNLVNKGMSDVVFGQILSTFKFTK